MIEETGKVIDIQDDYAWVETARVPACNACSVRRGCGTSALASVFGRRKADIRVRNVIAAAVGDRVVIGIPESGLVRGSLAVYAMPLAGLFAGALAGHFTGGALLPGQTDLPAILGAVGGFTAGIYWLRHYSRTSGQDERYQPVMLRHQLTISD